MSCYGWESGTIKLPTAEVKRVRDCLRAFAEKAAATRFEEAQAFWKGLSAKEKRDERAYSEAIRKFIDSRPKKRGRWGLVEDDGDHDDLYWFLYKGSPHGDTRARRILQKDMPKFTGANLRFDLDEASITFKGREVKWYVDENNHAVDRAHEHPLAREFFRLLDTVKWTRGSGGTIVGNDEYNRESDYEGGGGNYITATYGPATKNKLHRGRGW